MDSKNFFFVKNKLENETSKKFKLIRNSFFAMFHNLEIDPKKAPNKLKAQNLRK